MKTKKRNKKGITLVEMLLYIALFGMIFLSIFRFYFFVNESTQNAEELNEVIKSAIFINEHFATTFYESTDIDVVNSTFDADNGVLSLIKNGDVYTYSIVGGKIQFNRSGQVSDLTNSGVVVDKLRFERVNDGDGQPTGAKVSVQITSAKNSSQYRNYETVYILE